MSSFVVFLPEDEELDAAEGEVTSDTLKYKNTIYIYVQISLLNGSYTY